MAFQICQWRVLNEIVSLGFDVVCVGVFLSGVVMRHHPARGSSKDAEASVSRLYFAHRPIADYELHATPIFGAVLAVLVLAGFASAQEQVSFPTQDGGFIYSDSYGKGDRGVVLAHGGRFNRGSWKKQARALANAGFRVLAIDFRGYGQSRGPGQSDPLGAPLHFDVLAAVRYLRDRGVKSVSVVGGSMGGGAAGDASIQAKPGEIDRVVFLGSLASLAGGPPEKLKGRKLFIVARDDTRGDGVVRLVEIRKQYEKTPEPKKLVVLEGSAHAQAIFETKERERLMREILRFLTEP